MVEFMSSLAPVALKVDSVKIDYLLMQHRYTSLKELAMAALRGKVRKAEKFSALKSVSFELHRGETLGLIGRNGSGKSTLLKACAGIITPASGTIQRNGTLTSLIELGAGFDGELSAEENVYLTCMLMGFDKKLIAENIDRIFDFAELQNFRTFPVKSFSSGMHARLGFACATLIDADIILIDEVLAVGDEAFQLKCLKHMLKLKESGRSIVFVSHDLGIVQSFCDRTLVLDAGLEVFDGDPKEGVEKLRSLLLPENYRSKIGDLSEGMKIEVDKYIVANSGIDEFDLRFSLKDSLKDYSWKFQIFGYGQQKPLLLIKSENIGKPEYSEFIHHSKSGGFDVFHLKFSQFPFQGGEFMSHLALMDGEKEISHVARGFRLYPSQTVDHEEYGILNIKACSVAVPVS